MPSVHRNYRVRNGLIAATIVVGLTLVTAAVLMQVELVGGGRSVAFAALVAGSAISLAGCAWLASVVGRDGDEPSGDTRGGHATSAADSRPPAAALFVIYVAMAFLVAAGAMTAERLWNFSSDRGIYVGAGLALLLSAAKVPRVLYQTIRYTKFLSFVSDDALARGLMAAVGVGVLAIGIFGKWLGRR